MRSTPESGSSGRLAAGEDDRGRDLQTAALAEASNQLRDEIEHLGAPSAPIPEKGQVFALDRLGPCRMSLITRTYIVFRTRKAGVFTV